MRDIRHHLTDELLMGYSAGTLPEAFNLVVATHVSLCDECRARLHSFDAVGGVLLEEESASMAHGALEATLALISRKAQEPIQPKPKQPAGAFPGPLYDYVGGDLGAVNWKRMGGGVRQAILKTSKDATVRLLNIPAGAAMPDHGHKGMELTLVLQGAFLDDGERFARGDIEVANEDLAHTPIADIGEDCICLTASDAPLTFNSLAPRLVQPFLRI